MVCYIPRPSPGKTSIMMVDSWSLPPDQNSNVSRPIELNNETTTSLACGKERRLAGVGYTCLKLRRALGKEDERCSSVLSGSHSKTLMSIPQKLYQFHDERGKTIKGYRPGGKWCNKCRACYYRKIKNNKRVSLLAFCKMMNM